MNNLWTFSLTVFMGFFAIMNPIANVPIFLSLTESADQKTRKNISYTANLTALVIVVAFILIGKYIFELFGITIPAFKIAGGILVFFVGFEMLQSKKSSIHHAGEVEIDSAIAISPLAIPILAGPGTIVTAMNFVIHSNVLHTILIIAIFTLLILLTHLAFVYSEYILKVVGKKHIMVLSKIMGLILAILGTNMVIDGIKIAFNLK